jgi:hypothetical protein
LSPNAQALEAFFAAEIESRQPPGTLPALPEEDSFDASLSSIDWGGPQEESLNEWSSAPAAGPIGELPPFPPAQDATLTPPEMPAEDLFVPPVETPTPTPAFELPDAPPLPLAPAEPESPPPFQAAPPRTAAAPSRPTGTGDRSFAGASRGDFYFDTGSSNFRFSDDYIQRITKSFTGSSDEMVLGKDPSQPQQQPVFPHSSHDSAPPTAGGGAWSETELQKVERLVRDEVQMVVREVVEKVAWEVIPELAENLIRKELDRVLKQMEEEGS